MGRRALASRDVSFPGRAQGPGPGYMLRIDQEGLAPQLPGDRSPSLPTLVSLHRAGPPDAFVASSDRLLGLVAGPTGHR